MRQLLGLPSSFCCGPLLPDPADGSGVGKMSRYEHVQNIDYFHDCSTSSRAASHSFSL